MDFARLSQLAAALEMARSPEAVEAALERARALVEDMSILPYNASRVYLPGLSLPATQIITVEGIPSLAGGVTSGPIPLSIDTPGVVVGLIGATLPNNSPATNAAMSFQLSLEQTYTINTGANAPGFTSFAVFGDRSQWMPTLLPARGSGGWTMRFANAAGADTATPIFHLAFLQGVRALEYCAGMHETMSSNLGAYARSSAKQARK